MLINTVAAYNSMVSSLQALGFSGFPQPETIDFNSAAPVKVNVSCIIAKIQPSSPLGVSISPYSN